MALRTLTGMAWHWRYEDEAGTAMEAEVDATNRFPSQADAESWLGEHWRTLVDQGIGQVTLLENGREVYGPMSLAVD